MHVCWATKYFEAGMISKTNKSCFHRSLQMCRGSKVDNITRCCNGFKGAGNMADTICILDGFTYLYLGNQIC